MEPSGFGLGGRASVGRRPCPGIALAGLLLPLLLPVRAEGQRVVGRLLESGTEQPILLGQMALTDSTFRVVESTLTDHEGRFELQAPGPGDYYVMADRIGYRPSVDGVLELGDEGYVEVRYYLLPRPVELEGVTASVERERTDRYLEGQGFYERQRRGFGHFIGPEELEGRRPPDTRDLLRRVPGIGVEDNGFAGQSIRCRAAEDPGATFHVYVDGVRVHFPNLKATEGRPDVNLEELVDMESLAAVEVYSRPSQVPIQYALFTTCVMLVWTKH